MGGITRRVALPAITVAAGLVAALILAESALWVLGVSHPAFLSHDSVRGFYAHRPGAEGWFTKEGRSYVKINKDGLRDREHEPKKPEDTIRIVVLGDSYAEAFQIEMEDAFWSVMGRELVKCKAVQGRKIEVINFGVSGYGTGLEWVTLQKRAWMYDPDIVLLAFLTGNDVRNNSFALDQNPHVPYFSIQNDRLILEPPHSISTAAVRQVLGANLHDFLLDHSRIVQLVIYFRALRREGAQSQSNSPDSIEAGLDNQVYLEHQNEIWRSAWEVTEAIIQGMRWEVTARGKVLFVATLSNGIQVHPNRDERTKFTKRLGLTDLFYPDQRIIDLARREHIPSVMLAPQLRDWAEKNSTCVHGFENAGKCGGHWNQHGHRVAGEILSREICTQVLGDR